MANQEKKVRVGVDSQGVESELKRMRAAAEELARGLISDARKYSTSSREVLQDIEEQIKAIEKRNRVEAEGRRMKLELRRDRGEITESVYNRDISSLRSDTAEDKLQIQLLREVIDTIKNTAKEEIRERRSEVERKLQESRSVNQLSPVGDEREMLKETIQQYELGKIQQDEIQQRDNFTYGRQGVNALSRMGSASNTFEAALAGGQSVLQGAAGSGSRFISGMGVAGSLAFMVAMNAVRASMPYERSLAATGGVTGQYYAGFGGDLSGMGYTMDEAIARRAAVSRAAGSAADSGELTSLSMAMQRGMGLDEGLLDQLLRVGRGDVTTYGGQRVNGLEVGLGMTGYLERTGAIQDGDLSILPEYLNILVGLGQEQVKRLGSVDLGVNTKMITALSTLDESFKNPEFLGGVVQSIYGGLSSAQSPQQEAMQYATLSRMKPGASMFELMKMREDPFGEGNEDYLENYLQMIQGRSGGNKDIFFMSLMGEFGLSAKAAESLGGGFLDPSKRENFSEFIRSEFTPDTTIDPTARAESVTGVLMASTAQWTNTMQQVGLNITDVLNKIFINIGESVDKTVDAINKHASDLHNDRKEFDKGMIELQNSSRFWDKFKGYAGQAGADMRRGQAGGM